VSDSLSVSLILVGLWRGWRRYRLAVAHSPRRLGRAAQLA
jgi:hypothetical protein